MAHGSGQQPDITPREVIECRGDPRAMGFAQGRSCCPVVRARVVHAGAVTRKRVLRALLPLTTGRVLGRGMGREVIRHYPHLSERIQGLARGADLPFEALMELFLRAVSGAAADRALSAEAAVAVGSTGERGGLVVARALSGSGVPGSAWILRHSRPEVGFASHEVTLPWLASAVAGVNERGVAVAIAPDAMASESTAVVDARAPDAVLLVQECLQRFSDIQGCADWCSKRPVSGRASIVVADASGSALALEIGDGEPRAVPREPGVWLVGGSEVLRSRLRSELAGAGELDLDALIGPGVSGTQISTGDAGAVVALEPGTRSLTLRSLEAGAGETATRLELPATESG